MRTPLASGSDDVFVALKEAKKWLGSSISGTRSSTALLDSTSLNHPPLFDGTTRLYIFYPCPYAQRVWIVRNFKGLQDEIKLVPIDVENKPAWYKEKVYPKNEVPALEHNGRIIGESMDLVKYVDANFGGPSLLPDVNSCMERAVLDQLAVYFVKRLDGYPTTLHEDEILAICIHCWILSFVVCGRGRQEQRRSS